MTNQRLGLRVAGLIFALISIGHVIRVAAGLEVRLGGQTIPMWPSIAAVIVFAALAIWFWRLANRSQEL